MTPNFAAFLAMLSHSEGSDRLADSYRACFTFRHTIIDLTYHPAEPRPPDGAIEWIGADGHAGELITSGLYAGEHSTAAGRYQLILKTFLKCKAILRLNDFGAASQNDCAILLIRQHGAFDDVNAGAIPSAIAKCHNEWASLPGGTSGEPEHPTEFLIERYKAAGGVLA